MSEAPASQPAPGTPAAAADALLARALKLAALPGKTAKEACARYGVTQAALRRAKKSLPPVRLTLEDLVLSGLGAERPTTPRALQPYLDWIDHVLYSEDEIATVLRALATRGVVAERADGWILLVDWP